MDVCFERQKNIVLFISTEKYSYINMSLCVSSTFIILGQTEDCNLFSCTFKPIFCYILSIFVVIILSQKYTHHTCCLFVCVCVDATIFIIIIIVQTIIIIVQVPIYDIFYSLYVSEIDKYLLFFYIFSCS